MRDVLNAAHRVLESRRASSLIVLAISMALIAGCSDLLQKKSPSLCSLGSGAFRAGEYEKAINLLTRAIEEQEPDCSIDSLWIIIGNAHNRLDRFDQAVKCYDKAIAINPDAHEAWVAKGVALRLTGNYDGAASCYSTALEINPLNPDAHSSIGTLHIMLDEPDRAVPSLERAIELEPQLAVSHGNLALAYAMLGRFEDAENTLAEAERLGYPSVQFVADRIEELRSEIPEDNRSDADSG